MREKRSRKRDPKLLIFIPKQFFSFFPTFLCPGLTQKIIFLVVCLKQKRAHTLWIPFPHPQSHLRSFYKKYSGIVPFWLASRASSGAASKILKFLFRCSSNSRIDATFPQR